MEKNNKIIIIASLIGIAILYILYSHININDILASFGKLNLKLLAAYVLVIILLDAFMTLRWDIILRTYKIKIPFSSLYLYRMAGFAVGFLASQSYFGGLPVQAALLKRNDVEFKKALSTSIIDKSLQFTTDLLFSATAVVLLFFRLTLPKKDETLILLILILPVIIIILYYYAMFNKRAFFTVVLRIGFLKKIKRLDNLRKHVSDIEKMMHKFFVEHYDALPKILIINLVLMVLLLFEYGFLIALFGVPVTIFSILVVIMAVSFSYALPVPMALGTLEISEVTAFSFLKLKQSLALSVSLFVRLKDLARSALGMLGLLYFGVSWKKIFKKQIK